MKRTTAAVSLTKLEQAVMDRARARRGRHAPFTRAVGDVIRQDTSFAVHVWYPAMQRWGAFRTEPTLDDARAYVETKCKPFGIPSRIVGSVTTTEITSVEEGAL